ncbi:hypothetical protein IWQ61_009372 [Dispira simplex]|nr:hypothetical protein IWQ61_009372 [Dispira simplex]
MTSDFFVHPSVFRNANTYSGQNQGLTLKEADAQRAHEINMDVVRHLLRDQKGLIKKVTGVSRLGIYEGIANKIEALKHDGNLDSDSLHQRLYNKARGLFKPKIGRREAEMYPQVKALLYLISLLAWEKWNERKKSSSLKIVLQRYLLPHKDSDIRGDPTSGKRHDVNVCWYDLDTNVGKECEAFLVHEEPSSKGKKASGSTGQTFGSTSSAPTAKKPSAKGKEPEVPPSTPEEPPSEPEEDVTQGPFWRYFAVIECKAHYQKSQELMEYGQLGWCACSALEALFERSNLWSLVVSATKVRFVFFTHGAAVSSEEIDVSSEVGRKKFINDFLRFYLCSSYRAGFDPTKRWLEDVKQWEVKCFDKTSTDKGKPIFVYVNPIPFKSRGNLFGRRTRCHRASLNKGSTTYKFILKESWTELHQDPEGSKTMNTEALPNEVRIFRAIKEQMGSKDHPVIKLCVPELKAGGSVLAEEGNAPDSDRYSTVAKYCGELNLPGLQSDKKPSPSPSPSTSKATATTTAMASKDSIKESRFRPVNRVHQRLLMEPVGQSMDTLHPRTKDKRNNDPLTQDEENVLLSEIVRAFSRLCYVIYILYTEFGVYHRDLSEGNVLVHRRNGDVYPLLIDFDHSCLERDAENDTMQSRTGTIPFMSILNLAGHSDHLTILDELESFLYLWVWKCTIGFSSSEITRPRATKMSTTSLQDTLRQRSNPFKAIPASWKNAPSRMGGARKGLPGKENFYTPQPKVPVIRLWAMSNLGTIYLRSKVKGLVSVEGFQVILDELRPEFRKLRPLFLKLREILFDWDVKNSGRKRKAADEDVDEGPSSRKKQSAPRSFYKTPQEVDERFTRKFEVPETLIEKSCRRLIARKAEMDDILEKFMNAIDNFIDT